MVASVVVMVSVMVMFAVVFPAMTTLVLCGVMRNHMDWRRFMRRAVFDWSRRRQRRLDGRRRRNWSRRRRRRLARCRRNSGSSGRNWFAGHDNNNWFARRDSNDWFAVCDFQSREECKQQCRCGE